MKAAQILLIALIIIAVAVGVNYGFTKGLMTFGLGLIIVAMVHSMDNLLDDD